jgi:dipeptidyl aminopeptidase/acylaminoacyl peptidase
MKITTGGHEKRVLPYGTWPSPITAEILADRVRLGDAIWSADGKGIFWLQVRDGKGRIFNSQAGKPIKPVTDIENDVRGTIGYGGGEFACGKDFLIFASRDGRLYRQDLKTRKRTPITPCWGNMASPAISPNQQWVLFVFSDGEKDLIGAVNARGHSWPLVLVSGADFYMQPTWHPDGEHIAWVEWDNPALPWQASRVKIGETGGMQIKLFSEDWVAGNEKQTATHPQFSPDGKWLSYIQVAGDWDQLVLYHLKRKEKKILVEGQGISFGNPGWVQGQRFYGWSGDSRQIFYRRVQGGVATLWEVDVKNRKTRQHSIEPYTWISQLDVARHETKILMRASSPFLSQRLIQCKDGETHEITKQSFSRISRKVLPAPSPIQWQAEDGTTIYGTYYPPTNPEFIGEGKPPLIVDVHAGPTMNNLWVFVPERAYFTSRGYAMVAVDYRGSTGYGRTYQDAIRKKWGIVDVEDAIAAAKAVADQGLCDESRMVIMGSSAGGFTVLNALIQFPHFFKAAICSYPVCDLLEDIQKTHKLERYYNEYLVGDPKKDLKNYLSRSPLLNAEKIADPIAVFHGENDRVVSIDQTQQLVEKLEKRRTPFLYITYPDEGHGFRKVETIRDHYQRIQDFLFNHLK